MIIACWEPKQNQEKANTQSKEYYRHPFRLVYEGGASRPFVNRFGKQHDGFSGLYPPHLSVDFRGPPGDGGEGRNVEGRVE